MSNEEIYSGGRATEYTNDKAAPAIKDKTIARLIPANVSECSIIRGASGNHCSTDKTAADVEKLLEVSSMDEAKSKLNCRTERCVLENVAHALPQAKEEIGVVLKVKGPTDSKLLSNAHIDATMRQFAVKFPEFYPYNFNMRNYADYHFSRGKVLEGADTLATVPFSSVYTQGKTCAGCIINTDTYQGDGKHWMALFVDARSPVCSVEFFNSSGNPPAAEWVDWMIKTKIQLEQLGRTIEVVKVTAIRHQQSKSECGVYSLFYVWARLHGTPYQYFLKNPMKDQLMFEFRQHLFEDTTGGGGGGGGVFSWEKYSAGTKIRWE